MKEEYERMTPTTQQLCLDLLGTKVPCMSSPNFVVQYAGERLHYTDRLLFSKWSFRQSTKWTPIMTKELDLISKLCGFIFMRKEMRYKKSKPVYLVNPPPLYIHWKDSSQVQVHNVEGPAIEWEDGKKYHYLNNVCVPKELIENNSPDAIDIFSFLSERNAEVRREVVRKYGVEKILTLCGGKTLDFWGTYELVQLRLPREVRIEAKYLKMKNPSIGVWHVEGVPPHITSVKEALAWRDRENTYTIPLELT